MRGMDAFRGITRRQLRVNYRSPALCFEPEPFSGSSTAAMTLPILPVLRAAGPELFVVDAPLGQVGLQWTIGAPNTYAYVVEVSPNAEGPFTILLAGLIARNHQFTPSVSGPLYIRVSGIEPNAGLTEPSNTVNVIT